MTPDLFDRVPIAQKFTRSGSSIVPPTPTELAQQRRDRGIRRSADHATREWLDKAVGYVRLHAVVTPSFLTEDVRAMAEADGLPAPPDKRAWGAVMRKAAHAELIKADGYAPSKSSNLSPKVRWRSLLIA